MFNEVETEPGISSETTIRNFCDFLAETKDTYHFSSCLWRPHEDDINFANVWGTNGWAANYTGVVLTKADTLIPYGGPDFTFNGNEWYPQLTIPMHSFSVSKNYASITFDIKLPDYNTLKDYMSAGSRSSLGGGSFTYDYSLDLGIYFSGTGVTGVGVTQEDLKNAFKDNETQLGNGETVTLMLPISGTFESDAVITGINVMLTHGGDAANFSGKSISISNIVFNKSFDFSENSLILNGGPDYTFNGNQWDPQLSVSSNSFTVADDYGTITVDIAIPDFTSLRSSMSIGSRSCVGGGEFGYGDNDLGIYFSGVGVTGVGVTQYNLFSIFDANAAALGNGETVTLTLPISGTLESGAVITGINVMLAHGGAADNFSGKSISISNFVFNPANRIMFNDGPAYTFNGNQWAPQLTINTVSAAVPANNGAITVDIAIPDFTSLRSSMSAGSCSTVGGGSWGYGGTDLGIYFNGTGVTGVGVTQYDLFNIRQRRNSNLNASHLRHIRIRRCNYRYKRNVSAR